MQIANQVLDEVFTGLSDAEFDASVRTLDHIIHRRDAGGAET